MKAVVLRALRRPRGARVRATCPSPRRGAGRGARARCAPAASTTSTCGCARGCPASSPRCRTSSATTSSGVIAEVGAGVRTLEPGRHDAGAARRCRAASAPRARPATTTCAASYDVLGRRRNGGYAELVAVPAVNCLPYPENLTWEEAAAMPLVFLTAWHMLVGRARACEPGEDVLVIGAGSGVGSAAIQIARLLGARVIATAGSGGQARTRARARRARRRSTTRPRTSRPRPARSPARRASRWCSSTSAARCSSRRSRRSRATGGS